ncbi:MAG: DUF3098 domain-containing protein [Bacteroidota bacterium]
MSKKPAKKKVVVTKKSEGKSKATAATAKTRTASTPQRELTFGRDNYLWMGIGFALVLVGLLLMSGGSMPSPDVWEEDIIYSTRRTVIAPFVILAGLGVEVYAIFKK